MRRGAACCNRAATESMMRVSMMALLALPSLVDSQSPAVVEFTAVVTAEGGTADFKWTEGEDVGAAAAAFCGEHVAEEHRAACAPAIAAQVENELKVRKQLAGLPALELEVQVGEEKTVFRHRDGGDVRAEASAFSEKYVADEQVAACAAHLVEGALQAAARPKRDPLEAEEPESAWDRLLGPQLVAAGGETVSVDAALAKKKNVALLFAADWCKPCRDFVPKLKAYYKLAQKLHPDKVRPEEKVSAAARFKMVAEAHATLSSPERRSQYDREQLGGSSQPSSLGAAGQRTASRGVTTVAGVEELRRVCTGARDDQLHRYMVLALYDTRRCAAQPRQRRPRRAPPSGREIPDQQFSPCRAARSV